MIVMEMVVTATGLTVMGQAMVAMAQVATEAAENK
jgi:hypothetical protein